MQEFVEITQENIHSLADVMDSLEKAATVHAIDLKIDFPRMRQEFGALWMIVRSRIVLQRIPKTLRIKTWLRQPRYAISNRDFALFDGDEEIGYAVQSWVLVDAASRTLLNMKQIPPLWELPTVSPERTEVLKRLTMPPLPEAETWQITSEELDRNGHLNNARYVRRAEKYAPYGATSVDIIYDHECFEGELLHLQAENGFVQGIKQDGTVSFRAHFYKGEPI